MIDKHNMTCEKFLELKNDRMIRALIGIDRKQFDDLVPQYKIAHQEIQIERIKNGEITRLPRGGKRGQLDSYEKQLFFILYYLKTYPTCDVLGFHFDLSAGHANDKVIFCMNILKRALKNLNVLPIQEPNNDNNFNNLIAKEEKILIDVTECSCVRPQNKIEQKDRYSGKKKRHTFKSLVISNTQKFILFVSLTFGGRFHDYNIMKSLFNSKENWFKNITIEADLGFVGADKDYKSSTILLPYKKHRRSKKNPDPKLTDEQIAKNKIHSKSRVTVEHSIGGMKQFFCLTHRIRAQSRNVVNKFVLLSAGLFNYKISAKLIC